MAKYVSPGVHIREFDFSRIVVNASRDAEVLEISKDFISRLKALLNIEENHDDSVTTYPVYIIMNYELVFYDNRLNINNLEGVGIESFEYSNPHKFNVEFIKEFILSLA